MGERIDLKKHIELKKKYNEIRPFKNEKKLLINQKYGIIINFDNHFCRM